MSVVCCLLYRFHPRQVAHTNAPGLYTTTLPFVCFLKFKQQRPHLIILMAHLSFLNTRYLSTMSTTPTPLGQAISTVSTAAGQQTRTTASPSLTCTSRAIAATQSLQGTTALIHTLSSFPRQWDRSPRPTHSRGANGSDGRSGHRTFCSRPT